MVRWLALLLLLIPTMAAAEDRYLSLIAKPLHREIVVGEMIPVTLRGVYDRPIALEKMEMTPSEDFDWVVLGRDDWHREVIDGKTLTVMERRLAIFPKRTGVSHFGPATHHLTIIERDGTRKEQSLKARPLAVAAGEFPLARGWKFAAHDVILLDQLSTDSARLQDGETVTRTVTLRASGVLPEMLPPRPIVSENWLITFAAPVIRRMELTPEGPISEVVWTWQFRPETGEPGVLEPVTIPYFNTVTRAMDKVEIAALPIGYESFEANRALTGQILPQAKLAMAAAGLAGLLTALGLILMREEPGPRGTMLSRIRQRWSPLPRLRLRRAARSGDLLALRGAAEAYLAGARTRDPIRLNRALRALDRAIYSAAAERPDGRAIATEITRAAR